MAKVDPKELEKLGASELTAEEAEAKAREIAAKKARFVQVLNRGFINDRLALANDLPDNRVGMWIRDRPEDISRHQALGGRIETQDDINAKGLHGTSDNRVRVGDVILASMPKEDYELLQEVRQEQKRARREAGEKQFRQNVDASTGGVIDESHTN